MLHSLPQAHLLAICIPTRLKHNSVAIVFGYLDSKFRETNKYLNLGERKPV